MKHLVAGALSFLVCATSAQAAAVMSFQQVGADVVGTLSGSLDLSGMTASPGYTSNSFGVNPQDGLFGTGAVGSAQTGYLDQISGPVSFGSGGAAGSSTSGDAVFLWGAGNDLWLPAAYASGSALSGLLTFSGTTLAGLGLTLGDHVYTLTSRDTLTVRIGPQAVPEPGNLPLVLTALALLGLPALRRR